MWPFHTLWSSPKSLGPKESGTESTVTPTGPGMTQDRAHGQRSHALAPPCCGTLQLRLHPQPWGCLRSSASASIAPLSAAGPGEGAPHSKRLGEVGVHLQP